MREWLQIAAIAILTACAYAPPSSTISDLGPMPVLDRDSIPDKDGGELRSAALKYYAQGDYVRALRFGYWAAQTIPTDVRLRLLLGIVYDGGFDRPDLALPEYQRALSLKPDRRFYTRLKRRIHYLNRRLLQDATRTMISTNTGTPLSENWLAVYPLSIKGPRIPDRGLEFGLLDWVLPEVSKRSANLHVDAFTSWIVAQVYREVANTPSPGDFARWCGAGLVLTGTMTDLGNDRLRIIIQLLSPQGEIAYESHPFEINTMSPDSAYSEILEQSATALGLMAPAKKHQDVPITNPASLSLYAHGLASYLLGQVANSDANIRDAASLNGPSALLMSRQEWSESDLLGGTEGGQMLDDYHRLLNLPDPDRVVRERLLRGHQLGSPALPGTSGNEMDDPYKPPRPEPLSP